MPDPLRVVVVGGGITGLAAAHALEQHDGKRPVQVTLLEATARLGGKLRSERVGRVLFEHGPDALFAPRPGWREFCAAVGVADQIVRASAEHRRAYILHRSTLHPLPPGMEAGMPRSPWALARTGLLSPLGKLRAALEVVLPPGGPEGDESVDALMRRRFGAEVAERIAAPMLGGVYTTDTSKLSLLATLPHLRQAERAHGSLLRAAWTTPAPRWAGAAQSGAGGPGGGQPSVGRPGSAQASPGSPFYSLQDGLEQLATAAASRLARTRVRLGARVRSITPVPGGGFRLALDEGESLIADRAILATPAFVTAEVLGETCPDAAQELAGIPYVSVAVVGLAYAPGTAALPPGSGFIVGPSEGRLLAACSWSSRKWPHVAPEGELALRCHLHADRRPGLLDRPDEELVELVQAELRELLDVRGQPLASRVARWPRGVAAYHVGHLDRLRRIEQALAALPGLVLAGAGYRGVGVPDCIRQGVQAASDVLGAGASGEAPVPAAGAAASA
jgi:oxygen-dependent protoporphyrinogen oxidase